jgi:hypothetical protein
MGGMDSAELVKPAGEPGGDGSPRNAKTLPKRALSAARRLHDVVLRAHATDREPAVDATGQDASDLIKNRLLGDAPTMIGRLGAYELAMIVQYLAVHSPESTARKTVDYVTGRTPPFWWDDGGLDGITQNAGFFGDLSQLERFCELMLADLETLDVLGSWLSLEQRVAAFHTAVTVRLRDLEPYYHRDPWTEALTGRTVLVVHPFAESIERQYERRSELFDDPRVLPAFELRTVKAVQSIAGSTGGFRSWFDAYEHMCAEIADTEFDVAIIGCGAYGFPLAAHVKRLGRKAVHLGGAVQILFGIKGKRWDQHEVISQLYNEHWVRPLPSERPDNYRSVEDGCYW